MKKISKGPLLITFFTFVISIILYYESKHSEQYINNQASKAVKPIKATQSVNFLVSDMDLIISDPDGLTKARLKSNKVKHNAKQEVTHLDSPILYINQPDADWEIKSKTGKLTHSKNKIKQIEKIILSDQIEITRNNYNNANLPFIKLNTEYIIYKPIEDVLYTDRQVTIKTKDSETIADGMEFYKPSQKMILLGNVHSIYQPENKPKLALGSK